jgi:hypothetical protein
LYQSALTDPPRRLNLRVLKRRGWLLVVCAVGVAALAWEISSLSTVSYTAQAVLVVPAGATRQLPGAGDEAAKLAATDAVVIDNDPTALAAGAAAIGTSPTAFQKVFTVLNDSDTGIIRLRVQSPRNVQAVAATTAVARLLVSRGESRLYPTGSLKIVQLPVLGQSTRSGGANRLMVPIGVILGLLLAIVLITAWERNDPRVDDVDGLMRAVGLPASSIADLTPAAAAALVRRWSQLVGKSDPVVAVLASTPTLEAKMATVCEYLRAQGAAGGLVVDVAADATSDEHPDYVVSLLPGGVPGGPAAGEAVAQAADLTVVVGAADTRVRDVVRALGTLERLGVACAWMLFAPRDVGSLVPTETTSDAGARKASLRRVVS